MHAVKQNSSLYEIPDLIDGVAGPLGCFGLSREADLEIIILRFAPCILPVALPTATTQAQTIPATMRSEMRRLERDSFGAVPGPLAKKKGEPRKQNQI